MKRKKKYAWMIIFPFEYPALQAYLNEMAEKGWKLKKIKGDRSCWLTFEADASQGMYYLVDYTKDYSMFVPDSETPNAQKYRSFVEEYGYEFICSNGPLMVYRSDDRDVTLREGTAEDRRIMRMSMHKTAAWILVMWGLYLLLLKQNYDGLLWSMYASGVQLQSFLLMLALNVIWLVQLLPYFLWLIRRRNVSSPKVLKIQSYAVNLMAGLLICMLIATLLTVDIVFVFIYMTMFLIVSWLVYHLWRSSYHKGVKIIGTIILIWLMFIVSLQYTLDSTYKTVMQDKPLESTVLSNLVMSHVDTDGLSLDGYTESSMLSAHINFSATGDEETADRDMFIDWYQIHDGILEDWTKSRFQSDEGMQQLCRGYGKPIKTHGITMYKGDYDYLFVKGNTYVNTYDTFPLDEDGWKLIQEMLEL